MPTTITVSQIGESSITTFYNKDTVSHTSLNSNFSQLRTTLNSLVSQTGTMEDLLPRLAASNTFTGTNTFNNITFASGYGITNTFILIDSDNTGAAATCEVRFERGSSGTDAYIQWDTTRYNFYTDAGTTRSVIRIADGSAANDGMTYGQGVKATGTVAETVTGVKTFDSYPAITTYVAPTANTQFAPKKYVDDQTSGLVTGGIIQQTSAPATTNNNLWIDTTTTGAYKFFRANGTQFDPVNGFHQGTGAPTSPTPVSGHTWIDTTSTARPEWKRYDGTTWQPIQTAYVTPKVSALTDGATIASDWSTGNHMTVTLAGNRTLSNPTNAVNGQRVVYAFRQDGTGSRTLAFDTKFRFGTDLPSVNVALSTAANKTDYLGVIYHSTDDKFDIVAFIKGY